MLPSGRKIPHFYLFICRQSPRLSNKAFVLTAEVDDPAASEQPQQGGEGGGHGSVWQHHVAHCRERTPAHRVNTHNFNQDDADLAPRLQPPAKKK